MNTIELVKMGMDFYEGTETGDMGNFRLRPAYKRSSDHIMNYYIKLNNGHYISGDFMFWRKNNTNNKEGDRLHMDFTEYNEKLENIGRFKGFEKYTKQLEPTIANIKMLLDEATGNDNKVIKGSF